jgi:hypothetical protein
MIEEAWAAQEHQHGVLPLIETFFEADLALGRKRGALGLFTPAPEPGWGTGAIDGERVDGGLLLRGGVRLPGVACDGAIVLVRLSETEHRLAWLDLDTPGVERRGSRSGGSVSEGQGPYWLHIDGAVVGSDLVSKPVTLDPGGDLVRLLEAYAGVWAPAAARCARDGVHALRRAARLGGFQTSQVVALGITEVEIEADLTAAAVQRGEGLAVAAAAARTLSAVAAKTVELHDVYGLEIEGPLAGGSAKTLTAFLGGALLLENELARALGIPGTREAHA